MVVSSTLVNVAEDAELRLVTLLGESAGESFQDTCTACLTGGDADKLIKTVVASAPAMQALLQLENEEAVAAVSLLAALVQKCKAASKSAIAQSLVDAICAGEDNDLSATERKITMVSVLYNMLDMKCTLLNRMLELAGKHAAVLLQPETTLGQLLSSPQDTTFATGASTTPPPIVTLLDSWKDAVTVQERRMLYSTVCKAVPETDSRKQRFLLLLLETYTNASVMDAAGFATAKDAAVGAIRDPVTLFRHQRDILSSPAIQALKKNDADLFGLLTVFQEGKLSDYEAYIAGKDEKAHLSKWGLDAAASVRYMRILSLCSLAAEHEEIPYTVIAETLKLTGTDQVESWVIAAVNSGLLQAKMDQLAQKVMVERCVVRRFDMEQWKNLQSRLSLWKENVGGILAALKQSQAAAAATPATN
jgi:translation initiation factor 3 subunit M